MRRAARQVVARRQVAFTAVRHGEEARLIGGTRQGRAQDLDQLGLEDVVRVAVRIAARQAHVAEAVDVDLPDLNLATILIHQRVEVLRVRRAAGEHQAPDRDEPSRECSLDHVSFLPRSFSRLSIVSCPSCLLRLGAIAPAGAAKVLGGLVPPGPTEFPELGLVPSP